MAFDINGATKLITLDSASVSAADIWSRWVDWHPANTQWPLAFTLVGGIALGGGLFIPPYFFLLNGWRVRPMNADHNLTITGNLFVDGGGVPVVATADVHQVNVNYTVPVQAQGISTSGSTGPTVADIVAGIMAQAQITPIQSTSQARIIEGTLTEAEAHRIMLAALAGKVVKDGTNIKFKSVDGLADRIDGTVDDLGNRTAVTLDGG